MDVTKLQGTFHIKYKQTRFTLQVSCSGLSILSKSIFLWYAPVGKCDENSHNYWPRNTNNKTPTFYRNMQREEVHAIYTTTSMHSMRYVSFFAIVHCRVQRTQVFLANVIRLIYTLQLNSYIGILRVLLLQLNYIRNPIWEIVVNMVKVLSLFLHLNVTPSWVFEVQVQVICQTTEG